MYIPVVDATPRLSSSLSRIQLRTVVLFTGNGGGAKVGSGEGLQQA